MKHKKIATAAFAILILISICKAQETPYSFPQDTLVREKLEQWQDWKFGVIIHWGL
jgi:alpha-L-fucosidase